MCRSGSTRHSRKLSKSPARPKLSKLKQKTGCSTTDRSATRKKSKQPRNKSPVTQKLSRQKPKTRKRAPIPVPPKVCWPTYRPRTIHSIKEEIRTRNLSSLKTSRKTKQLTKKGRKVASKKTGRNRQPFARKKPNPKSYCARC